MTINEIQIAVVLYSNFFIGSLVDRVRDER